MPRRRRAEVVAGWSARGHNHFGSCAESSMRSPRHCLVYCTQHICAATLRPAPPPPLFYDFSLPRFCFSFFGWRVLAGSLHCTASRHRHRVLLHLIPRLTFASFALCAAAAAASRVAAVLIHLHHLPFTSFVVPLR